MALPPPTKTTSSFIPFIDTFVTVAVLDTPVMPSSQPLTLVCPRYCDQSLLPLRSVAYSLPSQEPKKICPLKTTGSAEIDPPVVKCQCSYKFCAEDGLMIVSAL